MESSLDIAAFDSLVHLSVFHKHLPLAFCAPYHFLCYVNVVTVSSPGSAVAPLTFP